MPLPRINKQCTALTKQTKQPCKNPAAYGCRTCRYHGARKNIVRGKDHVNFVHGRRTLEAEKQSSVQSAKLQMMEDAMHLLGMTTAKRSRGRKASGYCKITSVDEILEIFEK
jgi:hypothetical protein